MKGHAVGKASVRERLSAMVQELRAALEQAEGEVELTGMCTELRPGTLYLEHLVDWRCGWGGPDS